MAQTGYEEKILTIFDSEDGDGYRDDQKVVLIPVTGDRQGVGRLRKIL